MIEEEEVVDMVEVIDLTGQIEIEAGEGMYITCTFITLFSCNFTRI